jgi:hypothetical protein
MNQKEFSSLVCNIIYIYLDPVFVDCDDLLDCRRVAEAEQEGLAVDLVYEVDVFARGIQDVADEVALDRVACARTLVVRHDALQEEKGTLK